MMNDIVPSVIMLNVVVSFEWLEWVNLKLWIKWAATDILDRIRQINCLNIFMGLFHPI